MFKVGGGLRVAAFRTEDCVGCYSGSTLRARVDNRFSKKEVEHETEAIGYENRPCRQGTGGMSRRAASA